MTFQYIRNIFQMESGHPSEEALTQLKSKISDYHGYLSNSYFIKAWINVNGHASLHIFYKISAKNFWALIETQKGIQFIPGSMNGFELIKIPLLDCKIMKKKLTNLEYPFCSPSSLIQFFRKELRYPIVKESVDGYTIQLNSNGLLGGGAKLSRMPYSVNDGQGEQSKEQSNQSSGSKEQSSIDLTMKFLLERYGVDSTLDTKDRQVVEKMAQRVNKSLPFEQNTQTNEADVDKHLSEFIDVYEEEYFDEVILEVLGKPKAEGKLELIDYTGNFNCRKLCIEMLRKSYFAKERAMGGIEKIVVEKVLARLAEQTELLESELKQRNKKNKNIEGQRFEKLLLLLQKKEELRNEFQSLSMREAKKRLQRIKDQLPQVRTEDQQELINEFCYSTVLENDPLKPTLGNKQLNSVEPMKKV